MAGIVASLAVTACTTTRQAPAEAAAPTPAEQARADRGRPPYTPADVQFMQGMIRHHAQAIVMTSLASTHAARQDVKILAGRIDVSQQDDIAFMQRWLRERNETVPEIDARHDMGGHQMPKPGASGSELMPGMLTAAQLTQLSAARGPEFDRLFLTFMIKHHEGALTMVDRLFSSQGAAQESNVFQFASDVEIDQNTEIERMRGMLRALSLSGRNP
ncbi:MAG TPA: DUF305 domain-containing protein [Gemmatimonadaceae bacterium]|nr:DUF305 domain-containing protein [Gemmatimonadaceae bacterium]